MEAVKFMKEYNRMCKIYFDSEGCKGCPLKNKYCFDTFCSPINESSYNEVTETVERWSKENPEELGKKYIIEIDMVKHDCGNKLYHVKDGPWVSEGTIAKLEEYKESEK